jgi:hypothetical protein
MRQGYIRTARSKGLPERAVFLRHPLGNVALPFITIVGASIPTLFAGSVILELVFCLPGMGCYPVNAALNYDYNVVMTTTMFFAIITLTTQLLTDLSYAWFDPRVSYGAKPLTLILTSGVLTGLTSCDRLGWSASACFPAGPPPHGGAMGAESEICSILGRQTLLKRRFDAAESEGCISDS